jgi:amidophosphoribosyltransferase
MCGVFGVCGFAGAAYACRDGLYQLGHRGEAAAGEAAWDDGEIRLHKDFGWVEQALSDADLEGLPGTLAIGHSRYPTAGGNDLDNAQPHKFGDLSLCANGDIVKPSYRRWRAFLEKQGMYFYGHNDAELLLKLIGYRLQKGDNAAGAIRFVMENVTGAYSALLLCRGRLIAFRDPRGFRPLTMARRGRTWVVASETCALDIVKARWRRSEILPGEMVTFSPGREPVRKRLLRFKSFSHCIFELIYFSRPDSLVFGVPVELYRERLGEIAGRSETAAADLVCAVPDSSNAAAMGFARGSGLDFRFGIIRNHSTGRTFIAPGQAVREDKVRKKLNPIKTVLNGKSVVLVDDSIVRGTTSRRVVGLVRKGGGAKKVHFRSSSPPITHSCFYGIATPTRKRLIASRMGVEGIKRFLRADSLRYASIDDLKKALEPFGARPSDFCFACFTGKYPTEV